MGPAPAPRPSPSSSSPPARPTELQPRDERGRRRRRRRRRRGRRGRRRRGKCAGHERRRHCVFKPEGEGSQTVPSCIQGVRVKHHMWTCLG
eukprot:5937541-Pyramimonas_sp.AAC.1